MAELNIPMRRPLSIVMRYGLGVATVAVAVMATLPLGTTAFVGPVFFLAVIVSAWFGGGRAGLLAAVLATLVIAYHLPPTDSLKIDSAHDVAQLIVFLLCAVLVCWLTAVTNRTLAQLHRARDELELRVHERTAELRAQAALLDLTHDTVFARDMNDVITYWNRGAKELYGWDKSEIVGKTSHEVAKTIFPAPLADINRTLLATGRWEGQLIHSKRDGSKVVVASRWALQRDEHGNPVAILETNNDITEQRRAEATLRDSEEQWRAVFENSPVMYFMVDANGTIVSVNPVGAEQLGYTADELIGRSMLEIFYEPDRDVVQKHVAACFGQLGNASTWELRKVRNDGTIVWVRETARAMRRTGRDAVALILCEDITERRRAEEALHRAQAELAHVTRVTTLGQLAASIAHEVNQPLAAIVADANASLNWLAAATPDLEQVRASLAAIVKDGHRAGDVIQRIRDLVKKSTPTKGPVDIAEVVREVVAMASTEARWHGVAMYTQCSIDVPRAQGDRVQLQQVLLNLVMNGIEAMKSVGDRRRELLIRCERYGQDAIAVAVRDSGVGFDPRSVDQIFDAFYTTKPEGLGMGLSISRSIVEAHGGRLWATANQDHGVTFQFTLPPPGADTV